MKRIKLTNGHANGKADTKWKPGREKTGGRKIGTPNKVTAQLKTAIIEAAAMVGYDGRGLEGLHGYLAMLAWNEPQVFGRLLEKTLPLQISGRVEGDVTHKHKYETVADLADALRERGLPPPHKMIELNPKDRPVPSGIVREHERECTDE